MSLEGLEVIDLVSVIRTGNPSGQRRGVTTCAAARYRNDRAPLTTRIPLSIESNGAVQLALADRKRFH